MNKHASYQDLRSHLAYLKLAATAEHLPAALEQAEKDKPGYTQFLHDLLGVEVDATERRKLAGRMRFAGFPSTKTLEEFDFTAQPGIDRAMVNELATLRFVEEKANLLLIGPPDLVSHCFLSITLGQTAQALRGEPRSEGLFVGLG
jgi:DNA replication protein DnaC